ncbi:MAG: N-acetyltransferase [Micavibrio aeruginosavorus]|uniref:N-acetyltransferase n=1 Tax=Micavibrio aeruginosavorus TaxID=349221 RepID=A0A2W5NC20_9BACT|nr:MAG: N-acetyltransferase [Micavibrio aeruginosavorus]
MNKWMAWAKELGTEEGYEIIARENHAEFILRKDIMIVGFEKASGKLVIGTGLHRMDWETGFFEIGYWVRTPDSGKGYASESTNALIRYAFNALGAKKVGICHVDGNDASARVIEKLGFTKTGYLADDGVMNDGTRVGRHWYARYDTNNLPELKATW